MKILIIRYSSIGDIVLTTPLVRALRAQQPDATLHYLTRVAFESLLSSNPHIDKLYDDETPLSTLRAERYDFVVDLQGNDRSKQLCSRLRVPHATFDKQDIPRILTVLFKRDYTDHRHVAERYFDAVKKFGVTPDGEGLECHYTPSDLTPLLRINPRHPQPADLFERKYAVIAVGAAHPTKRIPMDKLQYLCSKIDAPVLLLGDESDRRRIDEAQLTLHDNILNLCGRTTLMQTQQIVDGAAVVLAGDTGLMHLAAACHRPLILLWGCTTPELGFAPYKCDAAQMEVDLHCRPCHRFGRKRCPLHHYRCMNDHPWQRITQSMQKLLS